MKLHGQTVLACTCRGTMPIEGGALARACGVTADAPLAHELCRAELGRFQDALAGSEKVLVACTQEAPTFRQAQADMAQAGAANDTPLAFTNIRENAGWSVEAGQALPKMAALLAGAAQWPDAGLRGEVALRSEGVTVVYGRDDQAVAAAEQLKDRLDLTVIITGTAELTPPRVAEFPVVRGTITRATGYLGAFELVVDGFAIPLPSSRRSLMFGPARNGARSRCDLIIDLSGGLPLLAGHEHREGYLRASPDDPVAVQRLLLAATDLVGSFSKPRYVALHPSRCAHSRSGQIGCTRCLDVCPAGAITPAGDSVAIDPHICAGCGTCAAVCPSTAVEYVVPGAQATARWLRTVLAAYRDAGATGRDAGTAEPAVLLLLHDAKHGAPLIDALARFGDGLPARVIPIEMPGQFGLDAFATAFAFGAAEIRVLASGRDQARIDTIGREVALLTAILEPLGYGERRMELIATDDPDELFDILRRIPSRAGLCQAEYLPTGDKNALTMQALNALQQAAPTPADVIPLPRGAPIGRVRVDTAGCTLCLACVSACPTSALRDDAERPMLKFVEDACIQCGLCQTTCPEQVVHLEPRATFGAQRRVHVVIKEEEPAICICCAKPFGVKASIDKIAAQLAGRHWMFTDPAIVDRIRMCGDCRIIAQTRNGLDPYAGDARPVTRTTDDYR